MPCAGSCCAAQPSCTAGVPTPAAALAKQGWHRMTIVTIYGNNDRLCHNGFMVWMSNYYGLQQFHKPCDWGSRDNKTKCQYNKRVRWGETFGYFSSFFSRLTQEKIWLIHKFSLFIFTLRPLGEKYNFSFTHRIVSMMWNSGLMHKAGLDSLRVLFKCSCLNSLMMQCLHTVAVLV